MVYPTRDQFRELAKQGNLIPVYREILADTETPVSALQKLGAGRMAFLLESVTGGENVGRHSFVGVDPDMLITIRGRQVEIAAHGETLTRTVPDGESPLAVVREVLAPYRFVKVDGLPTFCGGAVGLMGYDCVRYFENLPNPPADDVGLPECRLMLVTSIVIFDHARQTIKLVANAHVDDDPDAAYDAALERIDDLTDRLRSSPSALKPLELPSHDVDVPADLPSGVESNFTREQFTAAVLRCKEYIAAGDVIQVVLSQRLALFDPPTPLDIYRCLRCINPSPYMYYLALGDVHIVGSSPEILVTCDDHKVRVRPIAGTRRRGRDREEDKALEEELLADDKERAEHIMLVDLGRNDIGRVCEYGSVEVTELMVVERYSHVMHIVSDVVGRLRPDADAIDVLAATFPAGTVSGAPKIRAMEIIDELEPTRRGPYAGAIGYFSFAGTMDTCITIRTVVLMGGKAYIQVGAGIVADSVPEREFQECLNKANGMIRAIRMAEGRPA